MCIQTIKISALGQLMHNTISISLPVANHKGLSSFRIPNVSYKQCLDQAMCLGYHPHQYCNTCTGMKTQKNNTPYRNFDIVAYLQNIQVISDTTVQ